MCPYISVPSSGTTGDVALFDGDSEMEGRVEVCRGGVWGAVYDSTGWNFNDAQVTCRQLGYPSECGKVLLVCRACVYRYYHRNSTKHLSNIHKQLSITTYHCDTPV